MKIQKIRGFYLSMPVVRDIGDGSQDALLIRIDTDSHSGWGQAEAAPLPCLAALWCPPSHSACKPVGPLLLGEIVETPEDIARIRNKLREQTFDLLQARHCAAAIDIALWDLLGRQKEEPVWRLLGQKANRPKIAYASQLFGDTPEETRRFAVEVRREGYRAAKFGWNGFGQGSLGVDRDHLIAAREGLGGDAFLLVDAGTVWEGDPEAALARAPMLKEVKATWLEEPFGANSFRDYEWLTQRMPDTPLAGGEGCYEFRMAENLIYYGGVQFVQIDAGRCGISDAFEVAGLARERKIKYVNHTFTSSLSLSASLQPYADHEGDVFCEYPVRPSKLAQDLTTENIIPNAAGEIFAPDGPGLGLSVWDETVNRYLQDVEIRVNGELVKC